MTTGWSLHFPVIALTPGNPPDSGLFTELPEMNVFSVNDCGRGIGYKGAVINQFHG